MLRKQSKLSLTTFGQLDAMVAESQSGISFRSLGDHLMSRHVMTPQIEKAASRSKTIVKGVYFQELSQEQLSPNNLDVPLEPLNHV
ncbi:hypothetical protein O9992_22645 [Vibrio lentus]|nr:hypothetical protein [Vibrio lentus]